MSDKKQTIKTQKSKGGNMPEAAKRYWLFAGYRYYARGGIHDLEGSFDSAAEAEAGRMAGGNCAPSRFRTAAGLAEVAHDSVSAGRNGNRGGAGRWHGFVLTVWRDGRLRQCDALQPLF